MTFIQTLREKAFDKIMGGVKTPIKINRTDNGLKGICHGGTAPIAPAFQFSRPHQQVLTEFEFRRNLAQGFTLHQ